METNQKIDHNSTVNQKIKEKFVGIHILANVSTMAEYILSQDSMEAPFTREHICNNYTYPEFYGTFAQFEGGTEHQRQIVIDRLYELKDEKQELIDGLEENNNGSDDLVNQLIEAVSDDISRIEDELNKLADLESEYPEIYEYWIVSNYLLGKLKEHGECVIESENIWGRCSTGQAILLDAVISRICEEMEILDGQANSWANH